jgi:hypothetical protein
LSHVWTLSVHFFNMAAVILSEFTPTARLGMLTRYD